MRRTKNKTTATKIEFHVSQMILYDDENFSSYYPSRDKLPFRGFVGGFFFLKP